MHMNIYIYHVVYIYIYIYISYGVAKYGEPLREGRGDETDIVHGKKYML
jgi:hypothetical protein